MNVIIPYRLIIDPTKQEINAMITASINKQNDSNLEEYKSYMKSSYFQENQPKNEETN